MTDLETVFGALGVTQAVLVGASAGGALAVDFALSHPDRVSGPVLAGAIVGGYGFSEHFRQRGSRAMTPTASGDYRAAMRNMVHDKFELAPRNEEARERLWELIEPLAEKHLENPPTLRMLPEWSAAERLSEIRVPTLIVVGEADIPDVHAHSGVLEFGIPGSERVVLEGAGHLIFFERPEESSGDSRGEPVSGSRSSPTIRWRSTRRYAIPVRRCPPGDAVRRVPVPRP